MELYISWRGKHEVKNTDSGSTQKAKKKSDKICYGHTLRVETNSRNRTGCEYVTPGACGSLNLV